MLRGRWGRFSTGLVRDVRFNPCGVASSNLEGWVIHPKGDLIEGYVVYVVLFSLWFSCWFVVFLSPVYAVGSPIAFAL